MSFLPYGSANPAVWFSAAGLSGAAHGALVAAFVLGSVPLLPMRTQPERDEPDFFVSLEILDAEIIEEFAPDTNAVLPLDEAGVLNDVLPETETEDIAALAPDTLSDAQEIAPTEIEPDPIPEAAPEPEPVNIPDDTDAELLPEQPPEETVPEVVADPAPVAPLPNPDTLLVDDMSPVEDSVISPLAEGGFAPLTPDFSDAAESPQAAFPDDPVSTDVVTLPQPEDITPETATSDDDTIALLVPEQESPVAEPEIIDDPVTEAAQPSPEADIKAEIIEPADPAAVDTPDDAEELAEPELTEDPVAVPGTPAGTVIENPTAQDVALGRLLQRIRTIPAPQCSLALPRRAGNGDVGLSLIGADGLVLTQYANRILDRTGLDPIQSRELIDARQCAVLTALGQTNAFPATRIGLTLDQVQLYSGQPLRGQIEGAGGLFITVLLIDDNGVVQDLSRFTRIEGQTPVFEVPVTRTGSARNTRQLLLVLGTKDAPIDLGARIGGLAQDVFALIDPAQLADTVFGVASFDVR